MAGEMKPNAGITRANTILGCFYWGISREMKRATQEQEEGLKTHAESPVQCLSHEIFSLVAILYLQSDLGVFPQPQNPRKDFIVGVCYFTEKSSDSWFSNREQVLPNGFCVRRIFSFSTCCLALVAVMTCLESALWNKKKEKKNIRGG